MIKIFDVDAGGMSYVDRGEGPPVVFVHGNPSSSVEFTSAIAQLETSHRCIAVDHIGFGASAKPESWGYLPQQHASNLAELLDSLDLSNVTMVVGDWGGPIGLSWCLDNPDRVSRLVVTNSWCWPVNHSLYYQAFSRLMGGPIGRYLIGRHNIFATQVVKKAWGTRTPLTSELHEQFTSVHSSPRERKGMWVFPKQILEAKPWLRSLWKRRSVLHSMNVEFVWGMQDVAFRPDILAAWAKEFPEAVVTKLDDVGHFPALEATDILVERIKQGG